jgi:hypothetical protein
MARAQIPKNGRLEEALTSLIQSHATLEQAMASLIQNQVTFVTQMTEINRDMAETKRINSERFAHIEAILMEHTRILQALPDAIREKIGFKAAQKP